MSGRTPQQACRFYIDALQAALGWITQRRLTLSDRSRLRVDTPYALALADMDPVRLDCPSELYLSVGQTFRIRKTEADQPFEVETTAYFYQFSTQRDGGHVEALAFHWTPDAIGDGAGAFPHLHLGLALLAKPLFIRSSDFHKIHIPTGRVSLEAIVRLAITEFGVKTRPGWEEILGGPEEQFNESTID